MKNVIYLNMVFLHCIPILRRIKEKLKIRKGNPHRRFKLMFSYGFYAKHSVSYFEVIVWWYPQIKAYISGSKPHIFMFKVHYSIFNTYLLRGAFFPQLFSYQVTPRETRRNCALDVLHLLL